MGLSNPKQHELWFFVVCFFPVRRSPFGVYKDLFVVCSVFRGWLLNKSCFFGALNFGPGRSCGSDILDVNRIDLALCLPLIILWGCACTWALKIKFVVCSNSWYLDSYSWRGIFKFKVYCIYIFYHVLLATDPFKLKCMENPRLRHYILKIDQNLHIFQYMSWPGWSILFVCRAAASKKDHPSQAGHL